MTTKDFYNFFLYFTISTISLSLVYLLVSFFGTKTPIYNENIPLILAGVTLICSKMNETNNEQ